MSTPDSPTSNWSLPRRLGFRFAFAYFVIYSFPFHGLRPDAERIVLEGKFRTDKLIVRLRASSKPTFFLEERGFPWINEFPLNR